MRNKPSSLFSIHRLPLAFLVVGGVLSYLYHSIIIVYVLSYLFHLINLQVFLFRTDSQDAFQKASLAYRTLAFVTLGVVAYPLLSTPLQWWALAPLALGLLLQWQAVKALGLVRTYYGVELGVVEPKRITQFPYNGIPHPMHLGILLQFVGLYFICPAFHQAYPFLILGHVGFTLLTALVEHFNIHWPQRFFQAQRGVLTSNKDREAVDWLREWSLEHFKDHLHQECSMHRYIKTLPEEAISYIDQVRYSDAIKQAIHKQYPDCKIVSLPMTDEFYISRYNYDNGGDQGLFDKHYDGNLRFLPHMSVVRSLIYISSDDHLEIVFDHSDLKANMKTYDFGLLDFHKEYHWVEGSYQPNNPPRILLKCNYYLEHNEPSWLKSLGIWLNKIVFYVVKAAMEYSKSPKTFPQRVIGYFCNLLRRLNNVHAALSFGFVFGLLYLSARILWLSVQSLL